MSLWPSQVLYPADAEAGDLVADVDWATGLIRMHVPLAEWQRVLALEPTELGGDDLYLLETITHEHVHVLQLITTGYLYELSLDCLKQCVAALDEHRDLDGIYAHRGEYRLPLEVITMPLGEPGAEGVRTIDILEGAAMLTQKRVHWPGLGPEMYERVLDAEAADAAYRNAYDAAVDILGGDAFDQFTHIASLSLMTTEPQTVFVPLARAFRDGASRVDVDHNHRLGIEFLRRSYPELQLGSATDLMVQGEIHPILRALVAGFNKRALDGELKPILMMAAPYRMNDALAELLASPALFPPISGEDRPCMYAPTTWFERTDGDPVLQPPHLHLLAAVSRLLLMDIEPAPPQQARRREAREAFERAVELRLWEFAPEERTDATLDNFGEQMSLLAKRKIDARMLRGTCFIVYPDERPDSPILDPEVRRFLRGLYERVPHLLYFLADVPEGDALTQCAAAHAPDAAVVPRGDGTWGVAVDMRMIPMLLQRIQAAAIFARHMGDDPRVLLGLFRAQERPLREAFEAVVLDPELSV
jgi:hypothetical protein